MVVECVGPPGAGKSTTCRMVMSSSMAQKLVIGQFSDIKVHIRSLSRMAQALLIFDAIRLHGGQLFRFVLLLFRKDSFAADSVWRYFKLCVFDAGLQQLLVLGKFDVILLDQWIIQGIWSATIFKSEPKRISAEVLRAFYFPVDVLVYFEIDAASASFRVGNRTDGKSRFEHMSQRERTGMISGYKDYLYELFQASSCPGKHVVQAIVGPEILRDEMTRIVTSSRM